MGRAFGHFFIFIDLFYTYSFLLIRKYLKNTCILLGYMYKFIFQIMSFDVWK